MYRRPQFVFACFALLLPLLTACGQAQGVANAPCSLLTTDDVARALNIPITTAQPQNDNPKYTICSYYTPQSKAPTPNPMVIVQINTQPVTATALQQKLRSERSPSTPSMVLGYGIFYAAGSKGEGGTLFVIKGNRVFSVAIVDSPQDQATTRHTLQLLAQTALGRWSN